jgi:UDP-glucose:(heptosyl)LPS alpha-1,3-glucosyltransferase
VITLNYGTAGGAEIYVQRLTEEIARTGAFEIHVLCHESENQTEGIHFHRMGYARFPRCLARQRLAATAQRWLKNKAFDLVHSYELVPGADILTIGTPHQYWRQQVLDKPHLSLTDFLIGRLEQATLAAPSCQTVVTMSSLTKTILNQEWGSWQKHMEVVLPGLTPLTSLLEDGLVTRKETRHRLGVLDNEPVFLFVGNNFEHKGLARALHALGAYRQKFGTGLLWVIGRGSQQPYKKLMQQQRITYKVTFFGLMDESIAPYYTAADGLLFFSRFETFGMVVAEALAAGLPVLVTPTVGAAEFITNPACGAVVGADEEEYSLVEKMNHLVQSRSSAEGIAACQQAVASLQWTLAAKQLQEIWNRALTKKQILA